ncbi:sugar-transfer associated ATP-grasp domain-containing protein [Colwellia piezophila]|uniref:sugar-transfer associated ATP-grasp domain-containing protein n=1 Tax=Colwellia piezophila TaxID=211668 RepID=UPI0003669980|nr:sugar-transfer associated ATP-grasp domain-containing protein [Colwellia piezophila]
MLIKLCKALALVKNRSGLPEFKSFYRQLFEICILLIVRRIGPGYYHLAEMGKLNSSWTFVFSFANAHEYHNAILKVNNPSYQKLSQHKAIEKAVLSTYGIPTSPLLGHLNSLHGLDVSGKSLKTPQELALLLKDHVNKIICFKPVEGFGGAGFRACKVTRENDEVYLTRIDTEEKLRTEEFYHINSCSEGVVVEAYIEQHPSFAKFHQESVNTVRVLVFRGTDGITKCLGMTLRMGQGGAIIDNATAGGIMANVNIDTGLMDAGVFMEPSQAYFKHHPTSNALLEGASLPYFKEVKTLACKALDAFPYITFAGFDVAVGVDGPIIIELNPKPDYVFMAINKLPSRYLFNVGKS